MNHTDIWNAINDGLRKAKKKFPNWPDHPAAQAGIVCEESGELMQACLEFKYEKGKNGSTAEDQKKLMQDEAIHTAVTAIRFLENLK